MIVQSKHYNLTSYILLSILHLHLCHVRLYKQKQNSKNSLSEYTNENTDITAIVGYSKSLDN